MGVPSFFKWLCKRYPRTVIDAEEAKSDDIATSSAATASTTTIPPPVAHNPRIDNLYLDMNGIIHNSCHPDEGGSFSEAEMLDRVWAYIHKVVNIVRPQRMIYMAIDGVAPRAKMNQQRSRRFRSAREAQDKADVQRRLALEWRNRGFQLPKNFEAALEKEEWDSNQITPGTPFMANVSAALNRHIEHALQHDPAWKHLYIIFSDATVPGEGEHKIVQWIRQQRLEKNYDPNTRHCLYGMDADLIMLGLATHERFFYIFREGLGDLAGSAEHVKCSICGEKGHYSDKCEGEKWKKKPEPVAAPTTSSPSPSPNPSASPNPSSSPLSSDEDDPMPLNPTVLKEEPKDDATTSASSKDKDLQRLIPQTIVTPYPFQFVQLPIMREYLARELALAPAVEQSLPFGWDFERVIDDFILLCMFVGNDFLPHLPSLEIKEGALEMLIKIYKQLLPSLGGYLSDTGKIDLTRLQLLLAELGKKENEIFARRLSKQEFHNRKDKEHKDKIMRIRRENAAAERAQNKSGSFVYELDGTRKEDTTKHADNVASTALNTEAPRASGFIHPSRQNGGASPSPSPSNSWAKIAASSVSASSDTTPTPMTDAPPATESSSAAVAPSSSSSAAVPIPAPKANLSAAALLRQKLKGGPAAAPAAENSPSSDPMDSSDPPAATPGLARQPSDPIPHTTAAMSSLSTAGDSTAEIANSRAAALLKQSLLGKRKEGPAPKSPNVGPSSSPPAAVTTPPSASSSSNTLSAPHVPAAGTSPPIELPKKMQKMTSSSNEASTSSSSSSAPAVYDPHEEDQYGNKLSSQSFEQYFANKWEAHNEPSNVKDEIGFGTDGWKRRYYQVKMDFDLDAAIEDPISKDARVRFMLMKTYLEGLCWVMYYYFHGPISWSWYFPFHYAPLSEDLAVFLQEGNLKNGVQYDFGKPFTPVAQLMAVLPEKSKHCVPRCLQPLMTANEESPLHSIYPSSFAMDLNGKKYMWQAVALLPFIDEKLLLSEVEKYTPRFTADEAKRNSLGNEVLYVNFNTPIGSFAQHQVYEARYGKELEKSVRGMSEIAEASTESVAIDTVASGGLSGFLRPYAEASVAGIRSALRKDSPTPLQVVSALYNLPSKKEFKSQLLSGIEPFTPALQEHDYRTLVDRKEFVPRNNHRGNMRSPMRDRAPRNNNSANAGPNDQGAAGPKIALTGPGMAPPQLLYPNQVAAQPMYYPPPHAMHMHHPPMPGYGFMPPPPPAGGGAAGAPGGYPPPPPHGSYYHMNRPPVPYAFPSPYGPPPYPMQPPPGPYPMMPGAPLPHYGMPAPGGWVPMQVPGFPLPPHMHSMPMPPPPQAQQPPPSAAAGHLPVPPPPPAAATAAPPSPSK